MATVNPPFVLTNAGATHTAENDRVSLGAVLTGAQASGSLTARGGVAPSLGGGMAVTVNTGLAISIASGVVFIPGVQSNKQGVYVCTNDATVSFSLDAAHATLPRIDLIVARIQDSQYSGTTDIFTFEKVTGTAASSPTPPASPNNTIILAQVTVPAGATSLVPGNIADTRPFCSQGYIICKSTTKPGTSQLADGSVLVLTDTGEIQVKLGGSYVTRSYAQPLVNVQTFTTSGTWTKPANAKSVWVRMVGGGGGGGGTTGGAAGLVEGGGGGGGGYCESLIDAATLGSTVTVTVGTGGLGGINGSNAGDPGTSSVFASMTANGGNGGAAGGTSTGGATTLAIGGQGGSATGGTTANIPGGAGGTGRVISGSAILLNSGGASQLSGQAWVSTSSAADGTAGLSYGGGGSGGLSATTTRKGGTGAGGIVIVQTFF